MTGLPPLPCLPSTQAVAELSERGVPLDELSKVVSVMVLCNFADQERMRRLHGDDTRALSLLCKPFRSLALRHRLLIVAGATVSGPSPYPPPAFHRPLVRPFLLGSAHRRREAPLNVLSSQLTFPPSILSRFLQPPGSKSSSVRGSGRSTGTASETAVSITSSGDRDSAFFARHESGMSWASGGGSGGTATTPLLEANEGTSPGEQQQLAGGPRVLSGGSSIRGAGSGVFKGGDASQDLSGLRAFVVDDNPMVRVLGFEAIHQPEMLGDQSRALWRQHSEPPAFHAPPLACPAKQNTKVAVAVLKRCGVSVVGIASNGQEALDMLAALPENETPDVVFMVRAN